MTTAHHGGDRGPLARSQRHAGQALTSSATGGEGGSDDGIEPIMPGHVKFDPDLVRIEPRRD